MHLVSFPDLIQHVYCFQYKARNIESDLHLVLGLGPRLPCT